MQPSQTSCSGFSVRCFTPGTKVSFRNFLLTTIVTKWRMDQKGSSTFHINFNQTLIVKIVIASFLQGDVWHVLGNADHPRHLSNAKLRLADQKCWSVKRRPTFLWGRIHFVNGDLFTHRACVVFIEHWSCSETFDKLIVKAREGGANSVGVWMQRRENIWIQLLQMHQRLEDVDVDVRDTRTKRWLEKKLVEAWKTGLLHCPLPSQPMKANLRAHEMEIGLNSCWAAVSKWEQSRLSAQMEEKYWGSYIWEERKGIAMRGVGEVGLRCKKSDCKLNPSAKLHSHSHKQLQHSHKQQHSHSHKLHSHQQQAKVHCTAARGPSWNDKILSWEIG